MLFCIDWTITHVQRQRRVHMQLELFPTPSEPLRSLPPLWEELNQRQRAEIIAALARLMSKAVARHPGRDNDER
jgi:hypothetical protein